jgi:hypothetical protein
MSKGISAVFLFLLCISFLPQVSAQLIADPENISYMQVEVTNSGRIKLNSLSASALAEELRLTLYIPQNDSRQKSYITKVMGPDSYRMGMDEYGNAQMIMEWKKPPLDRSIDYLVESRVEVETKSGGVVKDFPVTDMIRPSAGIVESAYMAGGGQKSAEKMLSVASWVNSYVNYDLKCENEALSAEWVHENRRGTCDEFSNLYLSMLRVLGYRSWYVVGFAHLGGKQEGSSSFGSHAWVEAEHNGKTYSIDPTWAESPVDATHITMARLPDSNFSELTEARSRNVKIEWSKDETRIKLLDYRENPRIDINMEAVPDTVDSGKNIIVIADMQADGCVLSRIKAGSCVSAESRLSLIEIDEPEKNVIFCGNKTIYWMAKAPEIRPGLIYTCPISAGAGGARTLAKLKIAHGGSEDIELGLSTQKILLPGQPVEVLVSVKNPGFSDQQLRIFAILEDQLTEKQVNLAGRGSGLLSFGLTAPQLAGDYSIIAFSSNGDLKKESLTVISERRFKITEIEIPVKIELGKSKTINVTLRNFGGAAGAVVRVQIGEQEDSRTIEMEGNGSKTVDFSYTPETAGEKVVSIALLDSDGKYQDAWVGSLEAVTVPSFKESIAKQIGDFFAWLLYTIGSVFRL